MRLLVAIRVLMLTLFGYNVIYMLVNIVFMPMPMMMILVTIEVFFVVMFAQMLICMVLRTG